jgi:dolichol-phosphate mannosyltransferase
MNQSTLVSNKEEEICFYNNLKLAIVIPMANEEDNVEKFVTDVLKVCRAFEFSKIYFFAILDNASNDGTKTILINLSKFTPELKVIYAPENRNVVDAYIRGYREAINIRADWILEMDAGFSHQPSDISKFFRKMKSGYDCVFGSRYFQGKKTSKAPLARHFMSKGGTILCNVLLGTKLSDMTSGFELFKREVLDAILSMGILSIGPFFQTEIRTFAHGFNITEVSIFYNAPSYKFRLIELYDAFKNLFRLFRLKIKNYW